MCDRGRLSGTLTSEDLELEGVVGGVEESAPSLAEAELRPVNGDSEAGLVLAACNGLVSVDGEMVGESMEVMGLKASGWDLTRPDNFREIEGRKRRLSVVNRFAFASSLARMSVVVEIQDGNKRSNTVLCKGAPETIKELLLEVPAG